MARKPLNHGSFGESGPPQRSRPDIPPHPSPGAGLPPSAEEWRKSGEERGRYRHAWWVGGGSTAWTIGVILAILIGLALLRQVIGPMLSPSGP